MLLLHGLGADGSSWQLQFAALAAAGLRPLAVDIPGFGQSAFAQGRWSIAGVAARLAEHWRQIAPQGGAVCGISMGGAIALQLALDYPALCRRLVLVNTFACLRPRRLDEWVYLLGRLLRANLQGVEAQASMVAWRIFPEAAQEELRRTLIQQIVNANPVVYRQAMRSLGAFDVRKRLRAVNCPVLVISGERDTTVALANQEELAQKIPAARRVVIPNGGHAVLVDQSDLFNRALVDFLTQKL